VSETKETTTQESSASIGDLLEQAQGDVTTEAPAPAPAPAAETKPEPTPEPETTPTATPAPEATATPEAPATAQPTPEDDPRERELRGLRQAMIAERQKARELASKLSQYEGNDGSQPVASDPGDPRFVKMTEMLARQQFPDYDEKYQAFAKEALNNPALYETVMASEFPGIAAYQAGKSLLFAQKYGPESLSDPEKMKAALEKEVRAEVEKKVRAEVEAKVLGVARERANQPTNISQGRAPSSDGGHVPYVEADFDTLLARALAPRR
jgi:hypothetical protein